MTVVLQVAALLGIPLAAFGLCRRFKAAAALGPVVLAYAFGILMGNLPVALSQPLSQHVAEAAVPLSIPLLLFPTHVRRWFAQTRTMLLSFGFACVGAIAAAMVFGTYLRPTLDEAPKISGMLAGAYIGGTVNLNAVGLALGVRQETFVLVNAADVVTGGLYLFVLISVAHRFVRWALPWKWSGARTEGETAPQEARRGPLWEWFVAFGLAVAIVAASAGVSLLLFGQVAPVATMLFITTLALAASFSRRVRELNGTTVLGDYAMLVFCAAIGSMVSLSQLAHANPVFLLFCGGVMLTAAFIHLGLARLFRIDPDTMLITSTAAIFGPPFIAPVARAMKNPDVVASGITMGLAGFAVGTYLGLATAWLLGV